MGVTGDEAPKGVPIFYLHKFAEFPHRPAAKEKEILPWEKS